jgi:hypothetical protein
MSDYSSPERERLAARRSASREDTAAAGAEAAPHPLISLQRQLGNAHIARMLAQRETAPEEEDELQLSRDPAVQRETAPEEEDELQLSRAAPEVGPEGGPVSDRTASRINAMRGGGGGLDADARAAMESSLGESFTDVRVHTGAESHQLNRSLGARAFTTGSDIFFGEDAGPSDQGLLAHELTHVVQQRGMAGGGPMTVGPAGDAYEAEAEARAAAVSSGAAPPAQRARPEEQEG